MLEQFKEFMETAKLLGEPVVLRIVEDLYLHGESTATDVARNLGIHIATAKKYLKKLVEKGIVQEEFKRKHIRKTEVYSIVRKQIVLRLDLEILSLEEQKMSTLSGAILTSYTTLFNQKLSTETKNPYEILLLIKSRVGRTGTDVVLAHALKKLDKSTLDYLTSKEILKKMEEMIKCRE
ncbi:MAG: ArsR/SmtB family transcription factor [Thermoplasmata archaeon]